MSRALGGLSEEVAEALAEKRAVVALETSVVAQGLPRPRSLEAARACEAAVRDAGAVPAAVAVLDGRLVVGLSSSQLQRLAENDGSLWKLGARDLSIALAQGATGATTVSATCAVAARFHIRVFATGGIGGVHRGAAEHGDISADLAALARFAVGVVCAGAKSVLDLPRTLEALETLGVPVVGVGTRQFPAFYSRDSGLRLEHRVDDAASAARVLHAHLSWEGAGGMVFAVPPPEAVALSGEEVERSVLLALAEAEKQGITGKAVTPFLLNELATRTGGRTLDANVGLLVGNARFAAELAVKDAALRASTD